MSVYDGSPSTLSETYAEENTCCLPPKAVARLGRGGVSDVAISPDETLVAVASRVGVWLYDAHTDDFVALIAVEGTGALEKIAFSTDGTRIAVTDWDGKTTVWDVSTRKMLDALTEEADASTTIDEAQWVRNETNPPACHPRDKLSWMVAFSPDGKHLVGLDGDDSLTLWNVRTGAKKQTLEKLIGYDAWTTTYESGTITYASTEACAVFDAVERGADGVRLCKGTEAGVPDPPVLATTISPSGIGTDEGRFPVWNLGVRNYCTLNGHTGAIHAIEFADDGALVGSRVADRLNEEEERQKAAFGDRFSYNMMWSNEISRLHYYFYTDSNKIVKSGRILTNAMVNSIEDTPITTVAFAHDGNRFATATEEHVNVWGVTGWPNIATLDVRKVESLAFSPKGTRIATGGTWPEHTVRVWEVETGELIAEFSGHKSNVSSLAFDYDGSLLASGSFDTTILLWDMTAYLSHEVEEVSERYVV